MMVNPGYLIICTDNHMHQNVCYVYAESMKSVCEIWCAKSVKAVCAKSVFTVGEHRSHSRFINDCENLVS